MKRFLISVMIGFMVTVWPSILHAKLKVAIIDTGLDLTDARFKSVLCKMGHKDFTDTGIEDTDGHGTHVAGLIKQYAGNSDYCLVILKFHSRKLSGKQNADNEVKALTYAVNIKVDIINSSEGGDTMIMQEYRVVDGARATTLLIGSVGNQGRRVRQYPGCMELPNTRCVGSTDEQGNRADFSNYGPWVNISHPGVNILSTAPNGKNVRMSGTSMSTAIETGLEIRRRQKALDADH